MYTCMHAVDHVFSDLKQKQRTKKIENIKRGAPKSAICIAYATYVMVDPALHMPQRIVF
jgi:hypothetical protein